MRATKVPLFLNPTAGRGRAGRRLPVIERLLADGDVDIDVHTSDSVGDLERQVRDLVRGGADRIVVAGGDGSVHEAVNGILGSDADCALGVIPTGTGNDFAKAAGIPLDWQAATRLLADRLTSNAPPRRIDAGRMNDRFFANGAGVGFDAKVTRIARAYRWPIGDLVYLYAIFRAMIDGITTPQVRIEGDGFAWDSAVTLANVANGAWIGGMFHIAPMADNADGQLDLIVAAPVSRLRIMRLVPQLIRGEHLAAPEVTHTAVRRLRIEATAPVPSHLDGEVLPLAAQFDIEILPGRLRLI